MPAIVHDRKLKTRKALGEMRRNRKHWRKMKCWWNVTIHPN